MVLIGGIKYACASCVKGHRSSKCTHTDRQLTEIKKKGRPNSQCSHCRELRKTRSVHGKCECAARLTESAPKARILPNGLSDARLFDVDEDGVSSPAAVKVNHLLNPCNCQNGGKCSCCCVISRAKAVPAGGAGASPVATPDLSPDESSPASSHSDQAHHFLQEHDWNKFGIGQQQQPVEWATFSPGAALVNPVSTFAQPQHIAPPQPSSGCCSRKAAAQAPIVAHHSTPAATPVASTSAIPLDSVPTPAPSSRPSSRERPSTSGGGCCSSKGRPKPTSTASGTASSGSYFGPMRNNSFHATHHGSSPYASPDLTLSSGAGSPSAIYMPSSASKTPLFVPQTHGTAACFCGDLCACPGCPQHDPFNKKLRGAPGAGANSCQCGPKANAVTETGAAGLIKPCCEGDLVLPEGVTPLEDILKNFMNGNTDIEGESLAGMWTPDRSAQEDYSAARPPLPSLKTLLANSSSHPSPASDMDLELTTSLLIAAGGGRAEQVNLAYQACTESRIGDGGGTPPPPMMEGLGCGSLYGEMYDGGCELSCECTTDCVCPAEKHSAIQSEAVF